MPRERDAPYVAAGFRQDAERLIQKFMDRKTVKFEHFAEVWRELGFSTIFMGRENIRELTEFIEECYRNTLLFMDASNAHQKLGAVYLLYSLYLKQPSHLLRSPVAITATPKQVRDLHALEQHFVESMSVDDVLDVQFVITKLFKMEAISISCFPIPMGPVVPMPLLKLEPLRDSSFKNTLGALSMLNEKEIKNIGQVTEKYEQLKKTLPFLCRASKTTAGVNRHNEMKDVIDELEDRYNAGLLPDRLAGNIKIEEEFRSLGQRRAMLKSQQFERAAEVGMQRRVRASSDYDSSSPSKSPEPVKRGRGRPKKKTGKRGRKKKVVEEHVKTENLSEVEENEDCRLDEENDYHLNDTNVDNPVPDIATTHPPHRRRPPKYPRPVRRHYFEDD